MNKCFNCGKEFEGNFCPNCGEKFEQEKTCPKCGKTLSGEAHFCSNCGYSFTKKEPPKKAEGKQFVNLLFGVAKYMPFVVFSLFSVLLFVFYSTPVAELILGEGFPNENIGNLYSMKNGILSMVPNAELALIGLIIFACLSVLYATFMGVCVFVKQLKYKDITIFKKQIALTDLINVISYVFYICVFIIGIVIISKIKEVDEGMGIITHGACPILLIVFSLVLAIISSLSMAFRIIMPKKQPELAKLQAEEKQNYFESEKLRKEEYYRTHTAPVEPKSQTDVAKYKKDLIKYKYAKIKYDKASQSKFYDFLMWIELNKSAVIIGSGAVVACIVICLLIPVFTNIFKISAVNRVNVGDTYAQVEKTLGKPYEIDKDGAVWKYYDGEHTKILDKIQKNSLAQENAMKNNNDAELEKLLMEELKLIGEQEADTYAYIEITFQKNEDQMFAVSSVYFDKEVSAKEIIDDKELKTAKIISKEIDVGYYVDDSQGKGIKHLPEYKQIDLTFVYSAEFKDGSFYKNTTNYGKAESLNGNLITFSWADTFSSYKAEADVKGNVLGEVDRNGVWRQIDKTVTSVKILDGATSVGRECFGSCANLEEVTIPSSVISFAESAFSNCNKLTKVNFVGTIDQWAMIEFKFASSNPLYYAKKLYINDTEVTDVNLTVATKVGDHAFVNCPLLQNLVIGDGVKSLGIGAFSGCENLTNVTIGNGVETITAENLFDKCYKITAINIDQSNNNYSSIEGVVYTKDNKILVTCPKGKTGSLTIPNGVEKISEYAFSQCFNLTGVVIPNSVTEIGDHAFYNCTQIETITLSDNVTDIKDFAFNGCKELVNITIPNTLVELGVSAFSNCDKLGFNTYDNGLYLGNSENPYLVFVKEKNEYITSCEINNNTKFIHSGAFESCKSLVNVTVPNGLTRLGEYSFRFLDKLQYNSYDNALYLGNSENPYVILIKAKDTSITSCEINGNTKFINSDAFRGCEELTSVNIPNGVISIGSNAFYFCKKLTSVILPDSIISIADYAFNTCNALTSIILGNNVKTIGMYAFMNSGKLTSITIPNTVTSIGACAFDDCFSLKEVNFNGTKAQWLNISKENIWGSDNAEPVIHCTDGDITQ